MGKKTKNAKDNTNIPNYIEKLFTGDFDLGTG